MVALDSLLVILKVAGLCFALPFLTFPAPSPSTSSCSIGWQLANRTYSPLQPRPPASYLDMANLSQNDRTILVKYPLDSSPDHLREPLRKVEQDYEPGSIPHNDAVDTSDSGPQNAISRLLPALQGHEVAFKLRSKIGSGDIASELYTLFRRVRNGNFNYEYYRAL